jgi:hypothetical protein
MTDAPGFQEPMRDENAAHPVATIWRPTLKRVVEAFVAGDFQLRRGIERVIPPAPHVAKGIALRVADYGGTLIALPEETWKSSISQWMDPHWDLVVDLWTKESGRSDLVLTSRVEEIDGEYRFEIDSVYVP